MVKLREFLESTAGAIVVLFLGLLIFSAICIACAIFAPTNEKIYLLFGGIISNFSGSLFTVITVAHNRQTLTLTGDKSSATVVQAPAGQSEKPADPPKKES